MILCFRAVCTQEFREVKQKLNSKTVFSSIGNTVFSILEMELLATSRNNLMNTYECWQSFYANRLKFHVKGLPHLKSSVSYLSVSDCEDAVLQHY